MTVGKAPHRSVTRRCCSPVRCRLESAREWAAAGYPCAVREATPARWRELLARVENGSAVAVTDAGFTEVAPGSVTVVALAG